MALVKKIQLKLFPYLCSVEISYFEMDISIAQ